MSNFAKDIETAAIGKIEAIVIGGVPHGSCGMSDSTPKGKLLTWSEARPYLDFDYDTGYGSPECPAIYAWTETRIIMVIQYDGSTSVGAYPRNPVDVVPSMPGG